MAIFEMGNLLVQEAVEPAMIARYEVAVYVCTSQSGRTRPFPARPSMVTLRSAPIATLPASSN